MPDPAHKSGRGWKLFRYVRRAGYVVAALFCIWFLVAFLSFRDAVRTSNERVPASVRATLSPTDGPAITSPRNILLLGSDTRGTPGDTGRADSIMLVRTDFARRRVSMLSLPRDLLVPIPGHGEGKINSAYALGGPALTIKTVRQYTGVPIHHIAVIDFSGFRQVVDDIGGITIQNPHAIAATKANGNDFDGRSWYFPKGELKLDGRHALAYARIRKDDAGKESDLTRAQRQQRVLDSIASKIASTESIRHPRGRPHAAVTPLTTDATASQLMVFAASRFLAGGDRELRCRLGGSLGMVDGESVILGDEDNRATVRMFLGKQAPLKPNLRDNAFAPGCTKGE